MVAQKKFRKNEKKKQLIGGISNDTLLYIIGGVIVGLILLMFLYIVLRKPSSTPTEVEALKNKITDLLDQVNKEIPRLTSSDRSSLKTYNVGEGTQGQNRNITSWRGLMPTTDPPPGKSQYMLLVKDVAY